jgi:exopolysaccharide biosynthesis polyprenyl glycosylphosphotransferase
MAYVAPLLPLGKARGRDAPGQASHGRVAPYYRPDQCRTDSSGEVRTRDTDRSRHKHSPRTVDVLHQAAPTQSPPALPAGAKSIPAPASPRSRSVAVPDARGIHGIDLLTVLVAHLALGAAIRPDGSLASLTVLLGVAFSLADVLLAAAAAACWSLAMHLLGGYDAPVPRAAAGAWLLAGCTATVLALPVFGAAEHGAGSLLWLLGTASAVAVMLAARRAAGWAAAGMTAERQVLVVGTGPRAIQLARGLDGGEPGFRLIGMLDSECQSGHPWVRERFLGDLDSLERRLAGSVVDEVMIALPVRSCYEQIQRVIEVCERLGVEVSYPADIFRSSLGVARYAAGHPLSGVALRMVPAERQRHLKRGVDVAGSLLALVLVGPLLAGIALAVRLSSPGPVLFRQERFGYNRRRFTMYKFRTMVAGAETQQDRLEALNEAGGPLFKIRDDPRVTPLGRFLRRTSLDELPQLVNVLRGEMSLVGPRPLPLRDVSRFPEPWLMRRFSMYPGITGLWQIGGRSDLGFDDWIHLDLRYIDRWSLWLDLKILVRTVPAVLRGTGAS